MVIRGEYFYTHDLQVAKKIVLIFMTQKAIALYYYVMVHWKKIQMCHFQTNSRLYTSPLSSKNFGYIHVSMLLGPIFLLSSFLALYSNNIIRNGGTYAK
jgi:hypothetical protein